MAKRPVVRETLGDLSLAWCELNGFPQGIYLSMVDTKNHKRQVRNDRVIRRNLLPRRVDDSTKLLDALGDLRKIIRNELNGLELVLRLPNRENIHGNTRVSTVRLMDFEDAFEKAELALQEKDDEARQAYEAAEGTFWSLALGHCLNEENILRGYVRYIRKKFGRRMFLQALELEDVFKPD